MAKTSALKEQILNVLDELATMHGEIFNDPDPEVSEDHLSTLSDLVERLDKLVNYLPEETESVSDSIPIHPADCDCASTNYP